MRGGGSPDRMGVIADTIRDTPLICTAFADAAYVKNYGERFSTTLSQYCSDAGLCLVIINPDDEALELAHHFGRRFAEYRIQVLQYNGSKLPEFACCSRLMMGGELLRDVNRPMAIFDMDFKFDASVKSVVDAIKAHDVSITMPVLPVPWNQAPSPITMISAAIIGARPSPAATAFFAHNAAYCHYKLGENGPLWGVDQVSLIRSYCLLQDAGTIPFNLCETIAGLPDAYVAEHRLDFNTRSAMRTTRKYKLTGFSESGRFVFNPL